MRLSLQKFAAVIPLFVDPKFNYLGLIERAQKDPIGWVDAADQHIGEFAGQHEPKANIVFADIRHSTDDWCLEYNYGPPAAITFKELLQGNLRGVSGIELDDAKFDDR